MLPVSRTEGDVYAIAKFGLDRADKDHGIGEKRKNLWGRSNPRIRA